MSFTEAVHLDEELVQGLLAPSLAAEPCAAMTTDSVDLSMKMMRKSLLCLLEEVATREAPTPTNISTKS